MASATPPPTAPLTMTPIWEFAPDLGEEEEEEEEEEEGEEEEKAKEGGELYAYHWVLGLSQLVLNPKSTLVTVDGNG
ncbi:hypothetical protein LENED_009728 [Lentinula edodes]|uniref:Uncharacterized protein n=1 Tax=Lentinula edodes TaxID=5353 RepID=A0A1Q3EKH0_LENED|nr:hypothetical protein LENED_009728 [Lentinula edodes]